MKNLVLIAALIGTSAFAQAGSDSASVARAETAVAGNGVVTINNAATQPNTYARVDGSTNQAASAPSVFVNAPSADTCERAGFGLAAGVVSANAGLNIPRGQSDKCDVRADTVNLKFTGAPAEVIKARHCMDAQLAEAYARAGLPCVDQRPQQQAEAAPTYSDPLVAERDRRARQGR